MKISFYTATVEKSLSEIQRIIREYWQDCLPYKDVKIENFFDFVKNIKYTPDPFGMELFSRPGITIARGEGDCDCKTIICCAYFLAKNIPTGFCIVSDSWDKDYHHIFAMYRDTNTGEWIDYDCTYPTGKIGQKRNWYKRKNFEVKK